jgi:hypothetical protein
MATSNVVETVLKLRGSREFQSQAKESAKSLLGIGDAGDNAGKKAAGGWKGVAKFAGGAAAIGGAAAYMKSAASETEALAKSTMGLVRSTGMDTKVASEWASVLKVRGIDTAKFNVGLVKLSKGMDGAMRGGKKQVAMFKELGVSREAIVKGDVNTVLMQTADAFENIESPTAKATYAAQLFGKSGQALLPLLNAGSKGIQEQLDMAKSYGATLDGDATDAVKKQIAAQREWDMAMLGLKVQMGTGLLPAIAQIAGAMSKMLGYLKPIISNSKVLQITLITLTAAFVSYKLAAMAATLASLGLNKALVVQTVKWIALRVQLTLLYVQQKAIAAATRIWAAMQWLLNAAMSANPIGLMVIAIVGLIAIFVVLYTKVGWFRSAVQAVWNWIKSNWPLLLMMLAGPIGIAIGMIVRHFDRVKSAATSVWNFVKSTFTKIKDFISGIFSGAGTFVSNIGRSIADWINEHTPFGDQIKVGPLDFRLPALAQGGTMTRSGLALVGERGPEVVALPGRSTVYPNPGVAPMSTPPSLEAMGGSGQTIVTKVYLDRRQIAEAVGTYAADKRARR